MGLPPQAPVTTDERTSVGAKTPFSVNGRLRAYILFVVAVFYYFLARSLARHGAEGFASELWSPLVEQVVLAFLLLVGYAAMGFAFQRQMHPISEQGLPLRPGWPGEFGIGLATGWGIALLCIVPMTVAGGIAIALSGRMNEFAWFLADAIFFLAATLADELAFRGFAFQCFRGAVGPIGATIGFAFYYAMVQMLVPGSSRVSFVVSFVLALLLATAYLRTRALWVSWGINFGWRGIRALLFGLAVSGISSHSSVVQGDPMGAFWLTGGGFGLDGTWIACLVILAAFPVVLRITRELDFKYNAPVIIPGGLPVDLDAAAKAQHEAATGPAATPLVQIATVAAPVAVEEQPPAPSSAPSTEPVEPPSVSNPGHPS